MLNNTINSNFNNYNNNCNYTYNHTHTHSNSYTVMNNNNLTKFQQQHQQLIQQQQQQLQQQALMCMMISKAVSWWCDQISGKVNSEIVKRFDKYLTEHITLRFSDHWFPEEPTKGQAYRSLSIDKKGHTDPILIKAAKFAGIPNIYDCFSYVESIVMWIDPNELAVKIDYAFVKGSHAKEQVLYKPPITPFTSKPPSPLTVHRSSPKVPHHSSSRHASASFTSTPATSSPTSSPPPLSFATLSSSPTPTGTAPSSSPSSSPPYVYSPSSSSSTPSTTSAFASYQSVASSPVRPPSPVQPTPFPHSHKNYVHFPSRSGSFNANGIGYRASLNWSPDGYIDSGRGVSNLEQGAPQKHGSSKVYYWNATGSGALAGSGSTASTVATSITTTGGSSSMSLEAQA